MLQCYLKYITLKVLTVSLNELSVACLRNFSPSCSLALLFQKIFVQYKLKLLRKLNNHFQVWNRSDSPLINHSVFCHPPQPYSTLPVYEFWRNLQAFPFIPDSPFINSCAQSTVVAWSLGKATKLFDVCNPHHYICSL